MPEPSTPPGMPPGARRFYEQQGQFPSDPADVVRKFYESRGLVPPASIPGAPASLDEALKQAEATNSTDPVAAYLRFSSGKITPGDTGGLPGLPGGPVYPGPTPGTPPAPGTAAPMGPPPPPPPPPGELFSPARPMFGPGRFSNAESAFLSPPGAAGTWQPTPLPNNKAAEQAILTQPRVAMMAVLKDRNIDPSSFAGQAYLNQVEDLAQVYGYMAAGEPGSVTADPSQLYAFMQGFVDMTSSPDKGMQSEKTKQRGILKAQVEAALRLKGAPIYESLANAAEEGVYAEGRHVQGPWVYWYALIAPTMRTLGTTRLGLEIAQSRFADAVRDYQTAQFQGDTRSFQQYLADSGYKIPV